MTNGFQTNSNSNFETNLSAPTVISLDNQNAGWLIFIHKAPLKSVVNLAGGHPHPSTSPACSSAQWMFNFQQEVWSEELGGGQRQNDLTDPLTSAVRDSPGPGYY